jgi:hypothetical protein
MENYTTPKNPPVPGDSQVSAHIAIPENHPGGFLDLFDGDSVELHHKIPLKDCITKEELLLANSQKNLKKTPSPALS